MVGDRAPWGPLAIFQFGPVRKENLGGGERNFAGSAPREHGFSRGGVSGGGQKNRPEKCSERMRLNPDFRGAGTQAPGGGGLGPKDKDKGNRTGNNEKEKKYGESEVAHGRVRAAGKRKKKPRDSSSAGRPGRKSAFHQAPPRGSGDPQPSGRNWGGRAWGA